MPNTQQTNCLSPDTSIWSDIKELFADDGGWLHDIFLVDCSSADQLALLQFFTNGQFRIIVRDGNRDEVAPVEYPKNIEQYFADQDNHYLMTLYIGECVLNYWTFSDGYTELDLDSSCIREEKDFIEIYQFMKVIGDLISRKVNYAVEGGQSAIFHYDPKTQKMLLGGESR